MAFWNRKKIAPQNLDGLVKVRGNKAQRPLAAALRDDRKLRRTWDPLATGRRGLISAGTSGREFTGSGSGGRGNGDFYRYIRDSIPVISAGVWAWTRLCSTELKRQYSGSEPARARAEMLLGGLDGRILEMPYGHGSGMAKLIEGYYLELFTTGKFAGEAVLAADGKSVDHFRYIDPYSVRWEHRESGWTPLIDNDGEDVIIDPELFFYGTLGTDVTNPAGVEPLAAIPFVVEIQEMMLEDMARSNHNAGTPRLQVKITRPERYDWETDNDFHLRANNYFTDIVKEFDQLDPDENVFTWGDVEVAMVGGGGKLYEWRLNREQVIEDVISGMKLFPWVLGRTQRATHQWVQSQFDLLMLMVKANQRSGAGFADWLCNLELRLQGVEATARHSFDLIADPFRSERARAAQFELAVVDLKVQRGYISKDEGARELGYDGAFKNE